MRLALVNWAPVQDGAAIGGGVNGYVSGLARALHARGHEVLCLSSGYAYERAAPPDQDPRDPDRPGTCGVHERETRDGVRVFEIANSPIIAPAYFQFADPHTEMSSPTLERVFGDWLRTHAPDVVHFHNIEGLSIPCTALARALGARVVFSLHNYHTLCSQVVLMRCGTVACTSFENGHACWTCVGAPRAGDEMRRRAAAAAAVPPASARVAARLRLLPGSPRRGGAAGVSGDLASTIAPATFDAAQFDSPEWRPLSNTPEAEPADSRPPSAFGRRRAAMIDMLNACHSVLAVSTFVHRKFEAMGVAPQRLRTMHIGTLMSELTPGARPAAPAPHAPVRVLILGQNVFIKGLPMTLDALEMLTPEVLTRISLHVAMQGAGVHQRRLDALRPRMARLDITDGYSFRDIPALAADADAGLVPSVWWDNGPQTVLELLACGVPVIGPELGGIPDFVRHGTNGLLYRGNDRVDLARTLAGVAVNPQVLPRLRAGVLAPKSLAEHSEELETHYAELLRGPLHPSAAPDESPST